MGRAWLKGQVLIAALAGCGSPRESPGSDDPAPVVLYAGCEAVEVGPVCSMRPAEPLRLWVAAARDARLVLERDGVVEAVAWEPVEDGLRATVDGAAGALTLRAEGAGWRWTLGLRPAAGPSAALADIDRRSRAGDHAGALAALDGLLPGLAGGERAEAVKLRGDLQFRGDDIAGALATYEDAFAATRAAGLLGRANEVALTASYTATVLQQDLGAAERWLERHAGLVDELPEARLHHAYYAGLLAEARHDLRTAGRRYEEHARVARAIGLTVDVVGAAMALGLLRGRLGDAAGAEAAFAEALSFGERTPADVRARVLHAAAWVAFEARARGLPAADPEPRFVEALAIFSPGGAHADPAAAAEARINLAYARIARGDAAAARAALADWTPPNRASERWRVYLLGRADLLLGDHAAALGRFTALGAAAAEASDRRIEWSAAVGEGEAYEGLGDPRAAIAAYRRADGVHAELLAAIAVDGGRERFAAEQDRGAQRLVRLLLREGRDDEALCAARMARVAVFRGLAAVHAAPAGLADYRERQARLVAEVEATWDLALAAGEAARARLRVERRALDRVLDDQVAGVQPASPSCEELRGPDEGELLLVYFPLGDEVAAFARDAHAARSVVLPASVDAHALLAPFAELRGRARRVRILASGAVSAAAFDDALAELPVVYALDLPRPAARSSPLRRAVQLAPPSNLAGAEAELTAAASALTAAGATVDRLRGEEPDLLARISGADLLHYVGHARGDGWAGALALGGERSLGVGDLLSVAAPRLAVLGGCETGLLDPRAHAGGMSVAHALLLAGADAVIATSAVVDDADASAALPAVIAGLAAGASAGEALYAVRRAHAGASLFRAFVP